MDENKIREFQDRLDQLKSEKIRVEEKINLLERERDNIMKEMKDLRVTPKNVEKAIKEKEDRIERGKEKISKALDGLEKEIVSRT